MAIPVIWGQPLHLWLGIILLFLVLFQIVSAKRILPVPFRWHRINGYVIMLLALVHGTIAAGLYAGIFTIR